jgi:hypothetical protein
MRHVAIGAILGVACVGGSGTKDTGGADSGDTSTIGGVSTQVLDGTGTACLFGPAGASDPFTPVPDTELVADGVTEVQVVFETCASGCAGDITTACDAQLVGADVVVTGTASYTLPLGPVGCPEMCVAITAICEGPTLPAGSYTLGYGASAAVSVPSTGPAPCVTAP